MPRHNRISFAERVDREHDLAKDGFVHHYNFTDDGWSPHQHHCALHDGLVDCTDHLCFNGARVIHCEPCVRRIVAECRN